MRIALSSTHLGIPFTLVERSAGTCFRFFWHFWTECATIIWRANIMPLGEHMHTLGIFSIMTTLQLHNFLSLIVCGDHIYFVDGI